MEEYQLNLTRLVQTLKRISEVSRAMRRAKSRLNKEENEQAKQVIAKQIEYLKENEAQLKAYADRLKKSIQTIRKSSKITPNTLVDIKDEAAHEPVAEGVMDKSMRRTILEFAKENEFTIKDSEIDSFILTGRIKKAGKVYEILYAGADGFPDGAETEFVIKRVFQEKGKLSKKKTNTEKNKPEDSDKPENIAKTEEKKPEDKNEPENTEPENKKTVNKNNSEREEMGDISMEDNRKAFKQTGADSTRRRDIVFIMKENGINITDEELDLFVKNGQVQIEDKTYSLEYIDGGANDYGDNVDTEFIIVESGARDRQEPTPALDDIDIQIAGLEEQRRAAAERRREYRSVGDVNGEAREASEMMRLSEKIATLRARNNPEPTPSDTPASSDKTAPSDIPVSVEDDAKDERLANIEALDEKINAANKRYLEAKNNERYSQTQRDASMAEEISRIDFLNEQKREIINGVRKEIDEIDEKIKAANKRYLEAKNNERYSQTQRDASMAEEISRIDYLNGQKKLIEDTFGKYLEQEQEVSDHDSKKEEIEKNVETVDKKADTPIEEAVEEKEEKVSWFKKIGEKIKSMFKSLKMFFTKEKDSEAKEKNAKKEKKEEKVSWFKKIHEKIKSLGESIKGFFTRGRESKADAEPKVEKTEERKSWILTEEEQEAMERRIKEIKRKSREKAKKREYSTEEIDK